MQQQQGQADALKLKLHRSWKGSTHDPRCQPARSNGRLGVSRLRRSTQGRGAALLSHAALPSYKWPTRQQGQAGESDRYARCKQPDSRSNFRSRKDDISTSPLSHLRQKHKEAVGGAVDDPCTAAVWSQPPISVRCFQLSLGPPATQQQAAEGQGRAATAAAAGQGGISGREAAAAILLP